MIRACEQSCYAERLRLGAAFALVCLIGPATTAVTAMDATASDSGVSSVFEGDVRQVFKTHCFHCHGEAGVMEADLDLRLARFMIDAGVVDPGDGQPGSGEESYLLERMTDGTMPPEEVTIRPTAAEINIGTSLDRSWGQDAASRTRRPRRTAQDHARGAGLLGVPADPPFVTAELHAIQCIGANDGRCVRVGTVSLDGKNLFA